MYGYLAQRNVGQAAFQLAVVCAKKDFGHKKHRTDSRMQHSKIGSFLVYQNCPTTYMFKRSNISGIMAVNVFKRFEVETVQCLNMFGPTLQ